MYLPFEKMPDHARIWVYQSHKTLSENEVSAIQLALNEEVGGWAAHGAPLLGATQILYNRFVIIALNEDQNAASGCSIDASTSWLKNIGQQFGIDFFYRGLTYFYDNNWKSIAISDIKSAIALGELYPESITINTMIATVGELNNIWQIPADASWIKRYFQNQTLPLA